MTTTHRPAVEAHIEWLTEIDPDLDYEQLIRETMASAGWIDTDSAIQIAGWDSVLVDLNEATAAKLADEQYIEIETDRIAIGVEFECAEEGCPDCISSPADEDSTAGFMIPQDR